MSRLWKLLYYFIQKYTEHGENHWEFYSDSCSTTNYFDADPSQKWFSSEIHYKQQKKQQP